MRTIHCLAAPCCGILLLAGCTMVPEGSAPMMTTAEYAERPSIETSLFSSDQAVVSDEAIQRILSSKLEI